MRKLSIPVVMLVLATAGVPAHADQQLVTIPAGTEVEIELIHHLNSKYCPTGSAVHLRVTQDVQADGLVVIRSGTPVTGKIEEASKSKAMGRAGTMNFTVKVVEAVDGTLVPLDATIVSKGRKRTGATVGMVVAFGLPGLFSKGRMAYAEKGTIYSASVLIDREVDPSGGDVLEPLQMHSAIQGIEMASLDSPMTLMIEKGKRIEPVRFRVTATGEHPAEDLDLKSLQLVQVDDLVLPEPVDVASVSGSEVSFAGWSLMQYCDEGDSTLRFRGRLHDESIFEAETRTALTIKKKEKNKG